MRELNKLKANGLGRNCSKANNKELHKILKDKIDKEGAINFAEFMQQALYHPDYGYYTSALQKFGPKGDFITAPEIGSLFAKCMARQIIEILEGGFITELNIVEYGAGTGKLAIDLVAELNKLKKKVNSYTIVEISPYLQKTQQENIKLHKVDKYTNFFWKQEISDNFNGIVVANEVLDAFPVRCFKYKNNSLFELGVKYNKDNDMFVWQEMEPSSELTESVNKLELSDEIKSSSEYISEINLNMRLFFNCLAAKIKQAALIFVDYGFLRHEYYHFDRDQGTLVAHKEHKVSSNVLISPGLQDLTAHVDFTLLNELAIENKFDCFYYSNLANFLLENQLIDIVNDMEQNLQLNQEINLLTSPAEMGELFKVMILLKKVKIL